MPDVFHTFFGLAGLSLLGKLPSTYRLIDPLYALPTDIVEKYRLQGQVVKNGDEAVDERLKTYEQISN